MLVYKTERRQTIASVTHRASCQCNLSLSHAPAVMKSSVAVVFYLCAVLSAAHADHPSQHHVSDGAVHPAGAHVHQHQHVQQQQQQQQQQQPAQAHQLDAHNQRPYPLRRQSGLERARNQMMGFFRNIMNAGSRLRRMASERISTMLTRRSFRNAGRRQDRPQYVRQPQ